MSAFEFFFGFFGLVLGLSVTEIVTGFARILRRRTPVKIGYITPLLALFVLVDLASFWNNLWQWLPTVSISLGLLLVGMAVSAIYYFAASILLPDDLESWPSLDDYYDRHKRWVALGVLTANLLAGFGFIAFVTTPAEYWSAVFSWDTLVTTGSFSFIMLGIAFLKDRRLNALLIVVGLINYLV